MKTPENKKLIKKANTIVDLISQAYSQINPTTAIGDLYHTSVYYQNIGASEELGEMEYTFDNEENVPESYYIDTLQNLEDTLTYCKSVLKMQQIESKMGDPIFG